MLKKLLILLAIIFIFLTSFLLTQKLFGSKYSEKISETIIKPIVKTTPQKPSKIYDNLTFEYRNTEKEPELEAVTNQAFANITQKFNLDEQQKIHFVIFDNQKEFWETVFPNNENNHSTTGFANHVEKIVYLTSPKDTSIKSREDMLKVPAHELVHILIPHQWVEIREGIAVYLAEQTQDFSESEIPKNLNSIVTYQGSIDEIRRQYSFAGWKMKFIIEECLNEDYQVFLDFISTPNQDLDYSKLGYKNETEFLADFKNYLLKKAKPS